LQYILLGGRFKGFFGRGFPPSLAVKPELQTSYFEDKVDILLGVHPVALLRIHLNNSTTDEASLRRNLNRAMM